MTEPRAVSFTLPGGRILKCAALVCFVLDVLTGGAGWGARLHLASLGLALYVASEVL